MAAETEVDIDDMPLDDDRKSVMSKYVTSNSNGNENDTSATSGKDSNATTVDPQLDGLKNNVKDKHVFPVGTYRKISEATSTSFTPDIHSTKSSNKGSNSNRKWFVLAAAFVVNSFCIGFPFNLTVLNLAFLEEFGRSKAETALVQSVATGMFYIAGVLVGIAVTRFGCRNLGLTGSCLVTIGLVLSFMATSISFLVATTGFITGAGFSACYISASTSIGEYFDEKSKTLALSFLSLGSGCGSIGFPYLLDFLIEEFGWRGCLLIVGGLMANMIPCFLVCKPQSADISRPRINFLQNCKNRNTNNNSWILRCFRRIGFQQKQPQYRDRRSVVSTISSSSTLYTNDNINDVGFVTKLKLLAKNKVYVIVTLASFFGIPFIASTLIFLVNFLLGKGFDRQTAVFLYLCMNISSTIFRFVPGLCKSIVPHTSVVLLPSFYLAVGAVACAFLPSATTFIEHFILLVCFGMALGGAVTGLTVTTMKVVGMKNFSAGLGVTLTTVGVSNTAAGPLIGYIRDQTGTYTVSFYVVSACLGVATCLFILAATIRKYKGDKSEVLDEYLGTGRRGTRRRSSILPWKGKVEFIF